MITSANPGSCAHSNFDTRITSTYNVWEQVRHFCPKIFMFLLHILAWCPCKQYWKPDQFICCACKISSHFCIWMLVKTLQYYLYSQRHVLWCCRYAIGNAERPMLHSKVGWLDILANDTHQFYGANNTGGPSIKVHSPPQESVALKLNWTVYFGEHPLLGCDTV